HTEMFLDEARLTARLTHANIVHTYEVGEARGEYFIAMEYLEGQPLSHVLKTFGDRGEGLAEPFIAFIAAEALKGLHYAHEFCDFDGTPLHVVHRDVSPHNLFVTYSGEVKLLDFGIAKATLNSTHTEEGVLKGKVRYMAPEQALQRDFDRRADVFAFGVVLWEMLTRKPLFSGNPLAILTRLAGEDVPAPSSVRPGVPPALDAIALKATRRDRNERYATAEEMRLDLMAYLRGRSDAVSQPEVARLMNDTFSELRDEVRARLRAYLATVPSEQRISTPPGLTGTGSLPILPTGTGSHPMSTPAWMSLPVSDGPSVSSVQPVPSGRGSRWLLSLAIFMVVGAGVLIAWRFAPQVNAERRAPPAAAPPEVFVSSAPAPAPVPAETKHDQPAPSVESAPAPPSASAVVAVPASAAPPPAPPPAKPTRHGHASSVPGAPPSAAAAPSSSLKVRILEEGNSE
ncbi:MAG TPA: serine/threonine-protein kinase, partial [Polyangiaceae bacterium]